MSGNVGPARVIPHPGDACSCRRPDNRADHAKNKGDVHVLGGSFDIDGAWGDRTQHAGGGNCEQHSDSREYRHCARASRSSENRPDERARCGSGKRRGQPAGKRNRRTIRKRQEDRPQEQRGERDSADERGLQRLLSAVRRAGNRVPPRERRSQDGERELVRRPDVACRCADEPEDCGPDECVASRLTRLPCAPVSPPG